MGQDHSPTLILSHVCIISGLARRMLLFFALLQEQGLRWHGLSLGTGDRTSTTESERIWKELVFIVCWSCFMIWIQHVANSYQRDKSANAIATRQDSQQSWLSSRGTNCKRGVRQHVASRGRKTLWNLGGERKGKGTLQQLICRLSPSLSWHMGIGQGLQERSPSGTRPWQDQTSGGEAMLRWGVKSLQTGGRKEGMDARVGVGRGVFLIFGLRRFVFEEQSGDWRYAHHLCLQSPLVGKQGSAQGKFEGLWRASSGGA